MDKKKVKQIAIIAGALVIFIFILLIYNNIFAGNKAARNSDYSKYKLTNNEINSAKEKINELENVKSIDIHTNNNSKIVKIVVVLSDDVEFKKVKEVAQNVLTKFSEKSISYYDFEFYVDSEKENSEIYPKIGYKFRTNEEFSW